MYRRHTIRREANLVHVLSQVAALQQCGKTVTLFLSTSDNSTDEICKKNMGRFGLQIASVKLRKIFYPFARFRNVAIGLYAFIYILLRPAGQVISRNILLHTYLLWRALKQFMNATIEHGIRHKLQCYIFRNNSVTVVCISNRLKNEISSMLGNRAEIYVLPDAAFDKSLEIGKTKSEHVRSELCQLYSNPAQSLIVYVGQLYHGRGIEIVISPAEMLGDYNFGCGWKRKGCDQLLKKSRANLHFYGFIDHSQIPYILKASDCLLMPYQKIVSVGYAGSDTASWMSPMKMFEFMSSGVPFISSDLPVLREILVHEKNCLLVPPDDLKSWKQSVIKIMSGKGLAKRIATNARQEFLEKYTWQKDPYQLSNL